jgi:hypothetical protein
MVNEFIVMYCTRIGVSDWDVEWRDDGIASHDCVVDSSQVSWLVNCASRTHECLTPCTFPRHTHSTDIVML